MEGPQYSEGDVQMPMDSSDDPRRTGRACQPCAAMKTKCVRKSWSAACDRCLRMGRACSNQVQAPRRPRHSVATAARVAQLEQKIDGLVNLMGSGEQSRDEEFGSITGSRLSSSASPGNAGENGLAGSNAFAARPAFTPDTRPIINETHELRSILPAIASESVEVSQVEAQNLLDLYRIHVMQGFPCVVVPQGVTVEEIQQFRPFLWKVIVWITSKHNYERQMTMGQEIMEEIVDRLLLQNDTGMDLLQGLNLFTAWNHLRFKTNPQYTGLIYMLKGVLVHLRLERAPNAIDSRRAFMQGDLDVKAPVENTAVPPRTFEDRRALLSVFYLASAKCNMDYSRLETLQFSPYLEDCCRHLSEHSEHVSDIVLVNLVRIQRVVENILQMFPHDDSSTPKVKTVPMSMAIKALQADLEGLRKAWPPSVQNNRVLLMGYYAAEIRLYEVAMWDRTTMDAGTGLERIHHLEILNQCLASLRSYFDIYGSIPAHYYSLLPFIVLTQSGLMILIACRLCLLQYPGWDVTHARQILNILPIFDREVECFEYVVKERQIPESERNDIFSTFAQRMRKVKATYESRVVAENGPVPEQATNVFQDDFLMQDPFKGFDPSFWLMSSDDWSM